MPEYLRANEVATILGISPTAVYALFHRDDFPTTIIGRSYRVEKNALLLWLEENTNQPAKKLRNYIFNLEPK